jgi:hypothetical protein
MPIPDASDYTRMKKITSTITADSNTSIVKFRAVSQYRCIFPLYNSVYLNFNMNNNNNNPLPKEKTFKYVTLLDGNNVDTTTGGEPSNAVFDGTNTLYITLYFPTNTDNGLAIYNITSNSITTPLVSKTITGNSPYSIAYDSGRNCIYIGSLSGSITKFPLPVNNLTKSTLTASVNSPFGLAFDGNQYLYVASSDQNVINRIDVTSGTVLSPAFATGFNTPKGIAIDTVKNCLYVSDAGSKTIKKIDIATVSTSTLISDTTKFSGDMRALTIDTTNQLLYLADAGDSTVKQIDIAKQTVTTAVTSANLIGPRGVVFASSPYTYVLNTRANKLGRLEYS